MKQCGKTNRILLAALLSVYVSAGTGCSDRSAGQGGKGKKAAKKKAGPKTPRRPPPRAYTRPVKAIVGGTVINTVGKKVLPNATVLIKGNRIVQVGAAGEVKVPKDADVIDAKGKFIIPGLVDGHIHFFQSGGLYTRPDGLDLRHRVPYEKHQKWIRDNIDDFFRRYIRCGVTTVVDMGGPFWNFDVREKARTTKMAPRVFVAGPLVASYQPKQLASSDLPIIKVETKKQALDLVRKQIEKKTDLIKIWYVVSKKLALRLEAFYPIVKAVVDETHKHNIPVYVHATELETARKAVQAGADVLVHSVVDREVDEAFLKLAKEKKVIYIPTLWVFNSYGAVYSKQLKLTKVEHWLGNPRIIGTLFDMYELQEKELGERQKKLLAARKPIQPKAVILKNLKRIQDYGIRIAAGTDAGNVGVIHGPALFHDFALMSRAGLTNYQILMNATLNGAWLIRKEKELGSVEKGKLADLVVLNKNPLDDIMNTADIHLVIKDGNVFDPRVVLPVRPADLAQIQLNAYNSRDIETFLSVYAPDVEVYSFPEGKLLYRGLKEMRKRYTALFAKAPELHCKLVDRVAFGNLVFDQEEVTGIPGKKKLTAIAVYTVKDGLIRTVGFIK